VTPPAARAARTGRAGLTATGVSIACTIAVGAAGPSLMEPPLPGAAAQPPWTLDLHAGPYLVAGLTAAGLAAGTLGLALTLRAMRLGWTVRPRYVLLAGVIAAVLAGATGPFGTSDFLSYAAYGRELVTGHNPYLVAPATLARLGDPVARAVQDWAGTPSVYGAGATGLFGLASLIGGASARLTVFVLDMVNVLAFAGTGLLLDRLARGPAGRRRAAVLWTCNPLLLQILVAGGHVDGLAAVFSVAGIAVLAPLIPNGSACSHPFRRALAAGVILGLGFSVKPTVALVAAGAALAVALPLAHGARSARGTLAGLVAGFSAVACADIVLAGSPGVRQTLRASGMVSVGSPWRVVRTLLRVSMLSETGADDVVRVLAVVLMVCLAIVLLRGLPQEGGVPAGAVPFVLVLAWLLATPYVLPWYDALAWALLPLLPASDVDWLLLARTAALGFGYLPARTVGITIPAGLRWMEPVVRSAVTPAVLAAVMALLVVVAVRSTAGAARAVSLAEANQM
jgi:hypothetical protein